MSMLLCHLRPLGLIGIASGNIFLGLSTILMIGTHYKDWPFVYPPAITSVLAGILLLYGAIRHNQAATLAYLIFSGLSGLLYVVASIMLLMEPLQIPAVTAGFFLITTLICQFFWIYVLGYFLKIEHSEGYWV